MNMGLPCRAFTLGGADSGVRQESAETGSSRFEPERTGPRMDLRVREAFLRYGWVQRRCWLH